MSLDRLTDEQRAAVVATAPVRVILAGAGAGKTTTLVEVIASLVLDRGRSPDAIAALSFTRNAAGELRDRVMARIGPAAAAIAFGTSHAFALRIVRDGSSWLGLPPWVMVWDEEDEADVIRWVAKERRITQGALREALAYQRGALATRSMMSPLLHVDAAEQVVGIMRTNGAIGFDDILPLALRVIRDGPVHLRDRWRYRARYLIVDEYQDTAESEVRLFNALAPAERVVVGDANQNLYAFRGTSPAYLEEAALNGAAFQVTQCWRSGPAIVGFANRVVEANATPAQVVLRPNQIADRVEVLRVDPAQPLPFVLALRAAFNNGLRSVAILCRTNRGAAEAAAIVHDAGMPGRMLTTDRPFYAHPMVRAVHDAMKIRLGSRDVSLERRVCRQFLHREYSLAEVQGITFKAIGEDKRIIDVLAWEGLRWPGDLVPFAVAAIEKLMAIATDAHVEGRLAPLARLRTMIEEFHAAFPEATMQDYIDHIAGREFLATRKPKHAMPTIDVGTVHAAKGLEWDSVFLWGFDEGLMPLRSGEIDEERRVAYVGITRARTQLVCVVTDLPSHLLEFACDNTI